MVSGDEYTKKIVVNLPIKPTGYIVSRLAMIHILAVSRASMLSNEIGANRSSQITEMGAIQFNEDG